MYSNIDHQNTLINSFIHYHNHSSSLCTDAISTTTWTNSLSPSQNTLCKSVFTKPIQTILYPFLNSISFQSVHTQPNFRQGDNQLSNFTPIIWITLGNQVQLNLGKQIVSMMNTGDSSEFRIHHFHPLDRFSTDMKIAGLDTLLVQRLDDPRPWGATRWGEDSGTLPYHRRTEELQPGQCFGSSSRETGREFLNHLVDLIEGLYIVPIINFELSRLSGGEIEWPRLNHDNFHFP